MGARVLLGAHNVREAQEEGRIEMISTDIITHEKYNSFNLHNDIGLIHLPEKVNFTDILRPVCLPSHSEEDERWAGEEAQASGWGKPSLKGSDCGHHHQSYMCSPASYHHQP